LMCWSMVRSACRSGVLDRLVAAGLVEIGEEAWQGRLRRYYRITDAGRDALAVEAQRLAANAGSRRSGWVPAVP
jgi:DNA-binding PadR family transcriptional regulator